MISESFSYCCLNAAIYSKAELAFIKTTIKKTTASQTGNDWRKQMNMFMNMELLSCQLVEKYGEKQK